jgi:G3E family GTPase
LSEAARLTPVDVITGFLGSGKTTLLQRLLLSPKLSRTVVLINELGEVGLDHLLIRHVEESMVLLKSGCVCCTVRDDLKTTLRDLLSKRERSEGPDFDRIVVETTGIADPTPILFTLGSDPVLQHHFRLGNVVTTIDVINAARHLGANPEGVKQVAAADRLILTKTDLADPSLVAATKKHAQRLNPAAPVLDASRDVIDADRVLTGRTQAAQPLSPPPRRALKKGRSGTTDERAGALGGALFHHDHRITSFSLLLDRPLDWTAFGIWLSMLLNRHGENLLRVKGMLQLAGGGAPVLLNSVQHVVHAPVHLARWPTRDHRSRIVFITRGLDHQRIRRSLAAFVGSRVSDAIAAG